MAIAKKQIEVAERNVKGGSKRPAFSYEGVDRTSIRTDSTANFVSDISDLGNLDSLADFIAEGFNSLAEKKANPTKDETVKSVLAAMKSVGKSANIQKAMEIAARLRAEVAGITEETTTTSNRKAAKK